MMADEKMDRRIRRTRKMLKQGLAELMSEKDFKDITVKDITERMDLNRSTFYLHYTDTYDLLEKLENETLEDFQTMIDSHRPKVNMQLNITSLRPVIEPIADYLVENADICKLLFENKASNDFVMKFHKLIYRNGASFIHERLPLVSNEILDYCFGFITYGMIGMIKHWFDTEMKMDRQEIVLMSDRLITATTTALLPVMN